MKLGIGFMRYDLNRNNQKIIDFAIEHNINYFETCYFYLNHHCEEFVYDLLSRYNRNDYEICGKLSLNEGFQVSDSFYKNLYYEQLKRVPSHYFDYFLLQTLTPSSLYQIFYTDLYDFFQKEKEKGNIKAFGFTEQCDSSFLKIFLQSQWDIAQMPLNYFDWFLCQGQENYQLIKEKNIPIIAQAPYKGGLLIKSLPLEIQNLYKKEYNQTLEQVALNFVIEQQPDVILTGCSTLKTLQTTYNTFNNYQPLSNYTTLQKSLKLYQEHNIIPCILCGKCLNRCPQSINIPKIFSEYNKTLLNPDKFFELYALNKYFEESAINLCSNCGLCQTYCPIHLDIPKYFNRIFELRP